MDVAPEGVYIRRGNGVSMSAIGKFSRIRSFHQLRGPAGKEGGVREEVGSRSGREKNIYFSLKIRFQSRGGRAVFILYWGGGGAHI